MCLGDFLAVNYSKIIFHLSFSIYHFVITGHCLLQRTDENCQWKMENDKWKMTIGPRLTIRHHALTLKLVKNKTKKSIFFGEVTISLSFYAPR